jgi:hypothetical protein
MAINQFTGSCPLSIAHDDTLMPLNGSKILPALDPFFFAVLINRWANVLVRRDCTITFG